MSLLPEKEYLVNLEIAGISMSIRSFLRWKEEQPFLPFIKVAKRPDYKIVFQQVEELSAIPDIVIHEDACYRVHPDGKGGYIRSFFDEPRDLKPYALGKYNHISGEILIECLSKGLACVSEIHNSFFHIGFEALLIHKKRLCFHAACVKTSFGGILFSGPSGIGKSTQAELWCRFRDAKQINGDRPILSREQAEWLAWGSPYAGSSKIHINENCKVTAIVVLQQAAECNLQRLTYAEAFRAVWSGLTVHCWDKGFVEEAFELTKALIECVPVFRFSCTADEYAVIYLERELRKECCL